MSAEAAAAPEFVYLMKSAGGLYKIGRSAAPGSRRITVEQQEREPVALLCIVATANGRGLEAALHARHHGKRVRGEWFALAPADERDFERAAAEIEAAGLALAGLSILPPPPPPPAEPEAFPVRLKQLRQQAGLTAAQLAAAAGLHRTHVYKLEAGTREPVWGNVCKLADALGVPTDAFRRAGKNPKIPARTLDASTNTC